MTRHQLEVLEKISLAGRAGIRLWHTDINLATIRSLAKRGFVDTRVGGRVVVMRAGRRRLKQPWPALQPTGDQKDRQGSDGEGAAEIGASGAAKEGDALTGGAV
ncbi:MAG: hypothetical protein V3S33_03505 [Gammaproteobacteria bacterium]